MIKVFIDGREGTTGLQIQGRLENEPHVQLLDIASEEKKNPEERAKLINEADAVFLCLPDVAARESVQMLRNDRTVIIDSSTAHRTNPEWAYGFPELSEEHRERIKTSRRIAVPGCHATGFCALVYPLRHMINSSDTLCCFSLTGYSGGGKGMILDYENDYFLNYYSQGDYDNTDWHIRSELMGGRPYALGLTHKHLPEMAAVCGLANVPIFQPTVVPVRQGMLVSVPLPGDARQMWQILDNHYKGQEFIRVMPFGVEVPKGFMSMGDCNGSNMLEIFVFGHGKQALLMARFDNLGKGASGAAVQCLKLRFGI